MAGIQLDEEKIPKVEYTLKAEVKLRKVEEDENLRQAIQTGDQSIFDEIMTHMKEYQVSWGMHIKRYVYQAAFSQLEDISDLSDAQVEAFIYEAFEENGMKNRGSIHPKTATTLKSQLNRWMNSPSTKISRDTCFLFAFGLNMDEIDVSYMLQNVLCQADFNPRDYKEAIYYYCLHNNYKYKGVLEWLDAYEKMSVIECQTEAEETYVLAETLQELAENASKAAFLQYLAELKRQPDSDKKSMTCKRVMKAKLHELLSCLSQKRVEELDIAMINDYQYGLYLRQEERVNLWDLMEYLEYMPTPNIVLSSKLDDLVKEKIIQFPGWTVKSLEKMIYERTTMVHREDLLMATFLAEVCDKGQEFEEDVKEGGAPTYQQKKAWFVEEANAVLEECGFCDMYLLNPFELFLISCLLQERPMEYFLAAWRKYK